MNNETYKQISNRIRSFIRPPYYGYEIEDLIQDTILKLIEKKYTSKECLLMCKIVAFNIFADNYRKNKRFKNIYDAEPIDKSYQLIDYDFEIPTKYKELYVLKYKLNYKHKEISKILNIPIGTIGVNVSKMRKEIKRINGL